MGTDNAASWDDTQYSVMIGVREASVKSSLSDSNGNNTCVLCCFGDSETLWSLRWKVGVMVDLETEDLAEAKGAVDAMTQMEGGAAHG